MNKRVFIVTGEASGDKHASGVVRELLKINPDVEIEAIGGENLRKTGIKLFCDHKDMSAVGLSPAVIINHFKIGKRLVDYLKNAYKPDVVLLVD